ncbi:MAG: Lar family restriction alleviation protein [Oscillospiraceae bacterium]|nr:Lar family restriction alleviation protein [Oscillospiraceae bacterium]
MIFQRTLSKTERVSSSSAAHSAQPARGELIRGEQGRDGYITRYVFVRCDNCKASTRRVTYSAAEPHGEEMAYQKAANLWNRRS